MSQLESQDFVVVGRVSKPFGLDGWSWVTSFTLPPANLLNYRPWALGNERSAESVELWREIGDVETRCQSNGFLARIGECRSREDAGQITSSLIGVRKNLLPPPENDEHYWFELLGSQVVSVSGNALGTVHEVFDSGAHAVLRVSSHKKELLIPFVATIVREISPGDRILVDWESDW